MYAPHVVGKIYRLASRRLRCLKVRDTGINTFELIDKAGNRIQDRQGSMIYDHGLRLMSNNIHDLQEEIPASQQIQSLP